MRAQQSEVGSSEHSQQLVGRWSAWLRAKQIYLIGCVDVYIPVEGQAACRICGGNENCALIRAPGEPVLRHQPGMSGKGAFMSRKRAIDGRHCIRMFIGCQLLRTTLSPSSILFSRQQLPLAIA
ncbi:hypothetical protein ABIC09_005927 [Bradyrhizobium sp. S3.12.5]|uniref:hypothetical protein n=1 Tax=Bradyrhizobium sp. S3.12.5 TaxID=3156386 RepID=UPI0033941702